MPNKLRKPEPISKFLHQQNIKPSAAGTAMPLNEHHNVPRERLFKGDYGAFTAPLAMIGLLLSMLATLSSPINKKLSVYDLHCRGEMGSNGQMTNVTTTIVHVGLWGWCATGNETKCSTLRPVFDGWADVLSELPNALGPAGAVINPMPKSLLIAAGVIPILSIVYTYMVAVYGATSSALYSHQDKNTHKWQTCAFLFSIWVCIWNVVSFAIFTSIWRQVKKIIQTQYPYGMPEDGQIYVTPGPAIWLMLVAMILMLYLVGVRAYWTWVARTGRWAPPAFLQKDGARSAGSLNGLHPLVKPWNRFTITAEGTKRIDATLAKETGDRSEKEDEAWAEIVANQHAETLSLDHAGLPIYAVELPKGDLDGAEVSHSSSNSSESKA